MLRSTLEDRFVELCEGFGLPMPVTNAMVHGCELDAYFPEHDAFVELDTYGTHGNEIAFERDREKLSTMARHRIRGIAITDLRIDTVPAEVAADVAGHLGLPWPIPRTNLPHAR